MSKTISSLDGIDWFVEKRSNKIQTQLSISVCNKELSFLSHFRSLCRQTDTQQINHHG